MVAYTAKPLYGKIQERSSGHYPTGILYTEVMIYITQANYSFWTATVIC